MENTFKSFTRNKVKSSNESLIFTKFSRFNQTKHEQKVKSDVH